MAKQKEDSPKGKPTPIGDNVVIELTASKPSNLVLAGNDNDRYKSLTMKSQKVALIGPDCKFVKEGEDVVVDKLTRQDIHRRVYFGTEEESTENKLDYVKCYYVVNESEIHVHYV